MSMLFIEKYPWALAYSFNRVWLLTCGFRLGLNEIFERVGGNGNYGTKQLLHFSYGEFTPSSCRCHLVYRKKKIKWRYASVSNSYNEIVALHIASNCPIQDHINISSKICRLIGRHFPILFGFMGSIPFWKLIDQILPLPAWSQEEWLECFL